MTPFLLFVFVFSRVSMQPQLSPRDQPATASTWGGGGATREGGVQGCVPPHLALYFLSGMLVTSMDSELKRHNCMALILK